MSITSEYRCYTWCLFKLMNWGQAMSIMYKNRFNSKIKFLKILAAMGCKYTLTQEMKAQIFPWKDVFCLSVSLVSYDVDVGLSDKAKRKEEKKAFYL